MTSSRRSLLFASAAAFAPLPRAAWPQAYPARPVHVVEGYGPASAPDIIARLIGQWLGDRLGRPFVIESKPGASGRIASDYVAKAPSDGYTLLLVHNHPSGDPKPSRDDIEMTREIKTAAEELGIAIHNHLVIGRKGHASFRSLGLLS
jgi:tripartite-type tricarboxylate transporter receptor subunit TctC